MWKELIAGLHKDHKFNPSASEEDIVSAETKLAVSFPEELRSLLKESNGVIGPIGLGLIWTTQEIVENNLAFRNNEEYGDLYMPFDCLLFFSDSGCGDQYA